MKQQEGFISQEDLLNTYLLVIRAGKLGRKKLPVIRRHWKSAVNVCRTLPDNHIDIFYSGVFIASKKKGQTKLIMNRQYKVAHKDQSFQLELAS